MADPTLPSRFVSQTEIEDSNARRDEAWKAAYARIGQEPPKREEVDDKYDGRSLAEKLAANRAAKQEEFENSHKLSAQFRSLDPDEINFLDEVAVKKFEEEQKVKQKDEEELKGFRAAVQARDSEISPPVGGNSTSPTTAGGPSKPTTAKPTQAPAPKARAAMAVKAGLKGVVVPRKRGKATPAVGSVTTTGSEKSASAGKIASAGGTGSKGANAGREGAEAEEAGGDRKRRRVE